MGHLWDGKPLRPIKAFKGKKTLLDPSVTPEQIRKAMSEGDNMGYDTPVTMADLLRPIE